MNSILYAAIRLLFDLAEIILLVRVFISWIPVPRSHRLVVLLYGITDPVLEPIRRTLQRLPFSRRLMFDFSPLVAFLLLFLLRYAILAILF